jgi:hypothetical protein
LTSEVGCEKLLSDCITNGSAGQFTIKRRVVMSDSVMLFPNVLQPNVALKTYAPIGVKFWESQQAALDSAREFAEGWFARRQSGAQAALEAAKRISEAATPVDMQREYREWLKGATERMMAEGAAFQQHITRAGTQLSAQLSSAAETVGVAAEAQQSDARRAG